MQWVGFLERFLLYFQKSDKMCGLFYSTCRDLEMSMFLRIHAVQELYRRDRYSDFFKVLYQNVLLSEYLIPGLLFILMCFRSLCHHENLQEPSLCKTGIIRCWQKSELKISIHTFYF